MRNRYGRRVTIKQRVLRWLGVVSPSGAYPLPPRWAMSKLGRSRYYPEREPAVIANGDRSVAAGASIGTAVTGAPDSGSSWYRDVAAGPFPVTDTESGCAPGCQGCGC